MHIPGGIYHVIARGNSRERIFFAPGDYLRFLEMLGDALDRCSQTLHAYCLMTNHVHLVLQVARTPISALAQTLCSRFSRWSNRQRGRSGHLFERRHRAIPVHSPEQLLALVRYVHLNPIRAGIVAEPARYRWSSHAAYLGREADLPVATELSLSLLGSANRQAKMYRRLLDGDPAAEGESLHLDSLVAESEWSRSRAGSLAAEKATAITPGSLTVDQVLATVARRTECSREELRGSSRLGGLAAARGLAAAVVRQTPGLSLEALAKALGRDASTLSEASTRYVAAARRDPVKLQRLTAVADELARMAAESTPACAVTAVTPPHTADW